MILKDKSDKEFVITGIVVNTRKYIDELRFCRFGSE
jgi:hypothetical protein